MKLIWLPLSALVTLALASPMPSPQECPSACSACYSGLARCEGLGLSCIPSGLWPHVTHLNINGNNLTQLSSLSGFPKLKQLISIDNSLRTLDLSVLQGANEISHIYAYSNKISSITPAPEGVELPELSHIYLESNVITSLEGDLFSGVENLSYLGLDANPLRSIDVATLQGHFVSGGVLSIRNTPLECSCEFSDLSEWAKKNSVELIGTCVESNDCDL